MRPISRGVNSPSRPASRPLACRALPMQTFMHSPQRTHWPRKSGSASAPGGRTRYGSGWRACGRAGRASGARAPAASEASTVRRPRLIGGAAGAALARAKWMRSRGHFCTQSRQSTHSAGSMRRSWSMAPVRQMVRHNRQVPQSSSPPTSRTSGRRLPRASRPPSGQRVRQKKRLRTRLRPSTASSRTSEGTDRA